MEKKSVVAKISLLSISLVLTSAYTISGSLPLLQENFTDKSTSSIELLATIPAFPVIFMVILSGFIARKIGNKSTVSLGLIIVGIAGISPFFATTYTSILLSRLGLGIGLGLVNSLAVSLIGFLFEGKEKAILMGFRSSCENLGQAAMTFIAGLLLLSGWRNSYMVYLIAFPILFLFNLFGKEFVNDKQMNASGHQKINVAVVRVALLLLVLVLIYIAITIRLSSLVVKNGYGTATQASTILSLMTLSDMLAGVVFGQMYSFLNHYIQPLGLSALACGTIIIALSNTVLLTGIGAAIAGVAYPLIASDLFNGISAIAPKNSEVLATSLLLVGCNMGTLLAPYGLKIVSGSLKDPIGNTTFLFFGLVLVVSTITSFIKIKKMPVSI